MSAFIVNNAHIDTLVNAGLHLVGSTDQRHADGIGRMLLAENYSSVNYRYSENDNAPDYRATLTDAELSPIAVLSALHCYEYQSCEHPEWQTSDARIYCEAVRAGILADHPEWARRVPSRYDRNRMVYAYTLTPEYDAAPYEVTSLDQITVQRQAVIVADQAKEEAHRGEGAVYRSVGRLDVTEIAKRMRVNLRNAQAAGMLPEGATFSVVTERYSMGQSVTVTVQGMPDVWTYGEPVEGRFGRPYSDAASATLTAVRGMLNEYNRDRSDAMTDYYDVWFHPSVDIEDEASARWRAGEKAKAKARREARKARRNA